VLTEFNIGFLLPHSSFINLEHQSVIKQTIRFRPVTVNANVFLNYYVV
jgi:hypothetical protein